MIVRHSKGQYEVSFQSSAEVLAEIAHQTVVTDSNVAAHWPVEGAIVVPAGESSKSLDQYGHVLHELATRKVRRNQSVVAFGGGVVGDLVGFAAATYMRGISFTQVPTTLLAMVDSSIGGKVGIDLPTGKNLAGAFHAPHRVLVAEEFLGTLPVRQIHNGAAEVWKTAYIANADLLMQLRAGALMTRPSEVIRACLEVKRYVVQDDEFETTGLRAILNFGHTIGHAIEKVLGYETLLHGEAIAIGMVAETRLSERLSLMPDGSAKIVASDMRSEGLPTEIPEGLSVDDLIDAIRLDKKASGSDLAFSLLTGWGACKLLTDVKPDMVRATLIGS